MLGDQIKQKRLEKNLTQQDVANEFFVTRQTVSKWELNKSYPDLETIIKLSNFFEVSLNELMEEDVPMVVDENEENNGIKKVMKFKLFLKQDALINWLNEQKEKGLVCVNARLALGLFLFEVNSAKAEKIEYKLEFFSYLNLKEKKLYFSTMAEKGWSLLSNEAEEGLLLFSSETPRQQINTNIETISKMKYYLKTNMINLVAIVIALLALILVGEPFDSSFSIILLVVIGLCIANSVFSYIKMFEVLKNQPG